MSDSLPSCFDALGIASPDATRAEIRKAYAARLKQIDPDKDRGAFEQLRKAYETALEIAAVAHRLARSDAAPASELAPQPAADAPAQEPAPEAPSAAQVLVERLHTPQKDETDIARLFAVLRDPALSDPLVAQEVEYAIYGFFLERIDHAPEVFPHFRFAPSDEPCFSADVEAFKHLVNRLDRQFGWLSDGVRMNRQFYGYELFLHAVAVLRQPLEYSPRVKEMKRLADALIFPALFVIALVISQIWSHLHAPAPPPERTALLGQLAGDLREDLDFLHSLSGSPKPSASTTSFLASLAQEQHLRGETTSEVKLLVLRNALVRVEYGDMIDRDVFNAYSNPEELKYLLGVLAAARFAIVDNLNYRNTSRFHLTPEPDSDTALWINTQANSEAGLWQGKGGYVFQRVGRSESTGYVAVYTPLFLATMRRFFNGDARALEGALGLAFKTFDTNPEAQFYYYPEVNFSKVKGAPVNLAQHSLVHSGLGDNRWPIRAMQPKSQPCSWPANALLNPAVELICSGHESSP